MVQQQQPVTQQQVVQHQQVVQQQQQVVQAPQPTTVTVTAQLVQTQQGPRIILQVNT